MHPRLLVHLAMVVAIILVWCALSGCAEPELRRIGLENERGELVYFEVEAPQLGTDEFYQGLSGRSSLPVGRGMLFDWGESVTTPFWMKDTPIPLSIAFISEEGIIVDIQNMEPFSLEYCEPRAPYRYALEVNQGELQENSIGVGGRCEGLVHAGSLACSWNTSLNWLQNASRPPPMMR